MNTLIYCLIRKKQVKKTPEEIIRQQTLQALKAKGFSLSLISVEVPLDKVSQIQNQPAPDRRIDILVSTNIGSSIAPFLLIECKADKLKTNHLEQLTSYNYWVQSPYLAISNPEGVYLFEVKNNSLKQNIDPNWSYNSLQEQL